MTFEPILLLSLWAAGLAGAAAAVAVWRVARTGFLWLAGGVAAGIGIAVALAEPGGIAGVVLALVGVALARRPRAAAVALAGSALGFVAAGLAFETLPGVLIGALALGGITGEMLLGHWYLVDPRLPRWALHRLDLAGALGVLAEVALAGVRGTLRAPTEVIGAVFLGLAFVTVLLVVGVWFSLREKGYEGVMAATGLSYLATLTVMAVVFLARSPVEDLLGV